MVSGRQDGGGHRKNGSSSESKGLEPVSDSSGNLAVDVLGLGWSVPPGRGRSLRGAVRSSN